MHQLLLNRLNTGWTAFDDVSMIRVGQSTNLVVNPGFESAGNWAEVRSSAFPGTSFHRGGDGAAAPPTGSASYVIGNQADGVVQSSSIAVSTNKEYDLFVWASGKLDTVGSSSTWQVRALYYNSSGVKIGETTLYTVTEGTTTQTWQQLGSRLTTPVGAASLKVELKVQQANGWVTFDDVTLKEVRTDRLVYDAENRLVQVNGAVSASFVYDGDSSRVKSTVGVTSTVFVGTYYEVTGGDVIKYYYAGSQRVALRSSQHSELLYLFGDHLGSTTVSADDTGGNVSRQAYKPWGELRFVTTSPALETRYGFTGQYAYDKGEIGLIFYVARMYDPALGRFISADSIVPNAFWPGDFNRYEYVGNSPINFGDPTGHGKYCGDDYDPGCLSNEQDFYYRLITVGQSDTENWFMETYGIAFIEKDGYTWSAEYKLYVMKGVARVGEGFSSYAPGMIGSEAFRAVYGVNPQHPFKFIIGACDARDGYGGCSDVNGNKAGAYTWSYDEVEFYGGAPFWSSSGHPERLPYLNEINAHQVVHELGHAFNQALGRTPMTFITKELQFRDGGNKDGFHPQAVKGIWQQSSSTTQSEIFADQFLGWAYGAWGNDKAFARKAVMANMATWIGSKIK